MFIGSPGKYTRNVVYLRVMGPSPRYFYGAAVVNRREYVGKDDPVMIVVRRTFLAVGRCWIRSGYPWIIEGWDARPA